MKLEVLLLFLSSLFKQTGINLVLKKRFKNVALKVVSMKAGARQTIVFKLKTLNNVLVYSKNADSQPDDTFLECHIRPLIAIEYARLVKIHEI